LPPFAVARFGDGRFRGGSPVLAVAYAPDGQTIAAGHENGTVTAWDVGGRLRWRAPSRATSALSYIAGLAFLDNGRTLAAAGRSDPGARLYAARGGEALGLLPGPGTLRLSAPAPHLLA